MGTFGWVFGSCFVVLLVFSVGYVMGMRWAFYLAGLQVDSITASRTVPTGPHVHRCSNEPREG